jgi:type IV pilus assembly protein PilA
MKNITLRNSGAGFSLVEMLVVIAVIGILAAIAVPNIGRINNAAEVSKDRRNAQQLASVYSAASAAGYDFVTTPTTVATVDAVTTRIITGATVSDSTSPFYNQFFGVPNISATERAAANAYLTLTNSMLVYNSGL